MSFAWLSWSNPVALWWGFLVAVSIINIAVWIYIRYRINAQDELRQTHRYSSDPMVYLSAVYVFGTAFRAVLPRADVQRISLFDTWFSNALLGRSVATVAEVCFAIQWAIVLHYLSRLTRSHFSEKISYAIVPVIVVAELFSWYAVITTNYFGHVIEESLWTLVFVFIAISLFIMWKKFAGKARYVIGFLIMSALCYVAFESIVDVPMYITRWQAQAASSAQFLGIIAGVHDLGSRWVITYDIAHWREEIPWMSLYFSAAVWMSLILASFVLVKETLPGYLRR